MITTYLQDVRQRFTEFGDFTPVEPAELPAAAANWADGILVRVEPGLTTLVALVTIAPEGAMKNVCDDLTALADRIAREDRTDVQAVMLIITGEPLTRPQYDRWQAFTVNRGAVRVVPWVVDLTRGRLFPHQGPPFGIDPDLATLAAPEPQVAETPEAPAAQAAARQVRRNREPQPWATIGLLVVIVGVWLIMTAYGGAWDATEDMNVLTTFGAVSRPFMWLNGEFWRMFTAMFLHIGIVHLAVNGYSLWVVGRTVEMLYGRRKLIFIFLISGVAGSVVSCLFGPPAIVGAGASGAIFGLLGAVVWYRLSSPMGERILMRSLVITLALNLGLGLALHSFIDNWNHVGGLVGGFLAAAVVGVPAIGGLAAPRWRWSRPWRIIAAGLVVVATGAVLAGFVPLPGPGRDLARAVAALYDGQLAEAQAGLEKAAQQEPEEPQIRFWMVRLYQQQGRCPDAFAQLRLFIQQTGPDDPDAQKLESDLRRVCPGS